MRRDGNSFVPVRKERVVGVFRRTGGRTKVPRWWFFRPAKRIAMVPRRQLIYRFGCNCILAGSLNANGEPIARRVNVIRPFLN